MKKILLLTFFVINFNIKVGATPSTQIWNPSTDIQPAKTWHFGIDNYFSIFDNETKAYSFPTDIGLTYGLIKNVEVGIDLFFPTKDPLFFNTKFGLPEKEILPAVAGGIFGVGTSEDTSYNIVYFLLAKTFAPIGRFTGGIYIGNEKLLVNDLGQKDNTGIILSWDKVLTKKIWASVDYASGNNFYGSLSFGISYSFTQNISMVFGYVIYNNKVLNINDTFTTQLDINF